MLQRTWRALATPLFHVDLTDLQQSTVDVNERIDQLINRGLTGSTKWCLALLNRSVVYYALKDYVKSREDAIDAHEALIERCTNTSTHLFLSSTLAAKACRALSDEIDLAEKEYAVASHSHVIRTRVKPRTVRDMMRDRRRSLSQYLRQEAEEFERCAKRISQLPEKAFMRDKSQRVYTQDDPDYDKSRYPSEE